MTRQLDERSARGTVDALSDESCRTRMGKVKGLIVSENAAIGWQGARAREVAPSRQFS